MAIHNNEFNGNGSYKEMTLDDIGRKEEIYQNFLPVLPFLPAIGVGSAIGSKKEKKEKQKTQQRIIAAQEAKRQEYEKNKGRVAAIDIENKTCDELDNTLSDVLKQLSDEYNLNESQKTELNAQKKQVEDKIKEQKCAEQRQKVTSEKIEQAQLKLAKIEQDKKAKQKKILTYAGIGVGGLILTIIIIKLLRK